MTIITKIKNMVRGGVKADNNKESIKKYRLLLLTNRDSDNVGDQVIEACDIALIKTVIQNLGMSEEEFEINSRAASLISEKYIKSKDRSMFKNVEKTIQNADMIILGGAPMFNYAYQTFWERTAVTLEVAQKYNKPVIFSAIGIEGYDENNKKCQRLKKALSLDCVKQVTTRDGFELLEKYKSNEQLVIGKVADPAVFSSKVFQKYIVNRENKKKKVGIFVIRANGFVSNKIDFPKDDAVRLWKDIISELESRGYDYRLLTSGHFSDEAFMDYLIREHDVSVGKCEFNINCPEDLIKSISGFDAVISCRLHPSIISYSLGVPSVGIIWNPKVKYFYDCVEYTDRVFEVGDINSKAIVDKIEEIITEGVDYDKDYLVTVYNSLFYGIAKTLCLSIINTEPYTFEELIEKIPAYGGTSKKEQKEKLKRKFRRIYKSYNQMSAENEKYKKAASKTEEK